MSAISDVTTSNMSGRRAGPALLEAALRWRECVPPDQNDPEKRAQWRPGLKAISHLSGVAVVLQEQNPEWNGLWFFKNFVEFHLTTSELLGDLSSEVAFAHFNDAEFDHRSVIVPLCVAFCVDALKADVAGDERLGWTLLLSAESFRTLIGVGIDERNADREKNAERGRKGLAARYAAVREVEQYAVELAKSGRFQSARNAAQRLNKEVWRKAQQVGAKLSEDALEESIQRWFGKTEHGLQWVKRSLKK